MSKTYSHLWPYGMFYYQGEKCKFYISHKLTLFCFICLQIPCKHVFCLSCAKREDKVCPRCMEKVSRVEQTGLGTVFMCTHGGTRYGNAGCRRTYLSQRDLQVNKPIKSQIKSVEIIDL